MYQQKYSLSIYIKKRKKKKEKKCENKSHISLDELKFTSYIKPQFVGWGQREHARHIYCYVVHGELKTIIDLWVQITLPI